MRPAAEPTPRADTQVCPYVTRAQEGLADLALAVREGRTRLVGKRTVPPLQVQRALYLDHNLPDMAFIYLCNPTAGLLAGDHLTVQAEVGPGARAHLTTQAATKVYSMPEGSARLDTCLTLGQDSCLEYMPEPLIPFQSARLSQQTHIRVAPGATLIYGEALAQGRTARGENLAYSRLQNRLEVQDSAGHILYWESYDLSPAARSPLGRGVLGIQTQGHGYAVGTLIVVSQAGDAELLLHQVRAAVGGCPNAAAGASLLPGGQGMAVKTLAPDTASAQGVLRGAWAVARRALLGVDIPPSRRG